MIPVIRIGEVNINTYWVMLFLGAVGMLFCSIHRRDRFSLKTGECVVFTVLLTVVGFSGAKLLFVLENIESTLKEGISLGGVSFFGSVFLIPILMPIVGKLLKLKANQTMDICGPCVAIMIGCMRVGCFFSGCCGGWEVCMNGFCFHWPTQVIESICDFAILGILMQFEEQDRHEGCLYPIFMILYSGMRFLVEFLRDTPKDWLFMSHGQWFAIISIVVGFVWISATRVLGGKYDKIK